MTHEEHVKHNHKHEFYSAIPQLEKLGNEYLVDKAPFTIPENIREFFVKYGPYITVVIMILALPVILAALGLGAVFLPFAGYAAPTLGLGLLFTIASLVLQGLALPGLFAQKKQGWTFVFYANIVSFVSSLIIGDIVGALLGTLIGMFILFQIKSHYK